MKLETGEAIKLRHMKGATAVERVPRQINKGGASHARTPQELMQELQPRPQVTKLAVVEVLEAQKAAKIAKKKRNVVTKSAKVAFENRTRGLTEDGMLNDHDVNRSINAQRPVASQHENKREMKKRYEELATRSGAGHGA